MEQKRWAESGNLSILRPSLSFLRQNNLREGTLLMEQLLSCKFNVDTACVELNFIDGSMIFIDCTAVENARHRSALDYLIYNDPAGYADLIFNGKTVANQTSFR